MADPRIAPCIEVCMEYDVPILIHTGGIYTQGARAYFTLPVSYMANGSKMEIPVHVVNGAKPGPKLMLTALSQGV